ncbi:MAG: DUF393 domain-containing protein [Saprospiraceae bacterium]|nr:DUF393 domain-containing protein [Saprospiraceae bacterium]
MVGDNQKILYLDGNCVLCSRLFQFIIKYDRRGEILFSDLSRLKEDAGNVLNRGHDAYNTVVYSRNGEYYTMSTAALYILKDMGGLLSRLYWLRFIPQFVRDGVYKMISKNRYKWFGRMDNCLLKTPQLSRRIIK